MPGHEVRAGKGKPGGCLFGRKVLQRAAYIQKSDVDRNSKQYGGVAENNLCFFSHI